ncbi:MAG: patatin-like phospholipase family protein [archaeon]
MKKIGLTLSGGGLRGLAHLGVLKALYENGFYPDIVTGTSMGSIVAGLYAVGLNHHELMDVVYSTNSFILDPNILGVLKSLLTFKIPSGFIKGNKIEKLLNNKTNNINIKDIKEVKIAIVATNLNGGENIIFTNGNFKNSGKDIFINDIILSKAIRASISIPIVFKPILVNNYVLIDGGVVNNCPIDLAQMLGAEIIISSDISYNGKKINDPKNGKDIISNTLGVLLKEAYSDDHLGISVPKIDIKLDELDDIPFLAFSHNNFNKTIQYGYEKTLEVISEIKLALQANFKTF